MQTTLWRLGKFLLFIWRARTPHTIHSPYVYSLARQLFDASVRPSGFHLLEDIRHQLKKNTHILMGKDYGAGTSFPSGKNKKSIRRVVKTAVSGKKKCLQLFRISNFLQPLRTLELGSSVGISTCYVSGDNPSNKVISIEGNSMLADFARQTVQQQGKDDQIKIINDQFEKVLGGILEDFNPVDLVYLDGHHTFDATSTYYQQIKPALHKHSIVIIDDIYWSKGMKNSWDQLCKDPDVAVSLDFFHFGLLIRNPYIREKFHLQVVSSTLKWWDRVL